MRGHMGGAISMGYGIMHGKASMDTIKTHSGEIKITRGKKHTFLGMKLQITEDKKIEIDMEDQLMEAIDIFGE